MGFRELVVLGVGITVISLLSSALNAVTIHPAEVMPKEFNCPLIGEQCHVDSASAQLTKTTTFNK